MGVDVVPPIDGVRGVAAVGRVRGKTVEGQDVIAVDVGQQVWVGQSCDGGEPVDGGNRVGKLVLTMLSSRTMSLMPPSNTSMSNTTLLLVPP